MSVFTDLLETAVVQNILQVVSRWIFPGLWSSLLYYVIFMGSLSYLGVKWTYNLVSSGGRSLIGSSRGRTSTQETSEQVASSSSRITPEQQQRQDENLLMSSARNLVDQLDYLIVQIKDFFKGNVKITESGPYRSLLERVGSLKSLLTRTMSYTNLRHGLGDVVKNIEQELSKLSDSIKELKETHRSTEVESLAKENKGLKDRIEILEKRLVSAAAGASSGATGAQPMGPSREVPVSSAY